VTQAVSPEVSVPFRESSLNSNHIAVKLLNIASHNGSQRSLCCISSDAPDPLQELSIPVPIPFGRCCSRDPLLHKSHVSFISAKSCRGCVPRFSFNSPLRSTKHISKSINMVELGPQIQPSVSGSHHLPDTDYVPSSLA
jgi:hypothetical protein